jgi:predicted Rossmann fold nucleotide-binding protein DprA/Smf involved in DNA uptake
VSRDDTSFAALLLAQRLVGTPAKPLTAAEYWALLDVVPDPSELLGLEVDAVARRAGIALNLATRVVRLLDAATAVAFELDEQTQSGIRVLGSFDDSYPARLRDRLDRRAPPLLYAVGDVSLLRAPLVGIVGSRDVAEAGAEVAREAARAGVADGLGIVSGGAQGVDRLAMDSALDAGGTIVAVLADSLVRSTRDSEIRRAIADGRVCFCTPYKPTAGFTVANAMGRNKVIYALSTATLVVAADLEEGGAWAGAAEALRQRAAPVLVWTGDGRGPGNERLTELGATPIDAVDALFPLPEWGHEESSAHQLAFDV